MTRHIHQRPVFCLAETACPKGDALIETHIAPDDAGFSYHHTRAMIDGKGFANLRTGVDVDARLSMCQLADDAWQNGHFGTEQGISHAIM